MNPVLTQLPKAQDAYVQTVQNWTDVNTTDILLAADQQVRQSIEGGKLGAAVVNIQDIRAAEKAAIELQDLGYQTRTMQSGQMPMPDGSVKPLFGISICWKYMPDNIRDSYTV